ncbi:hypothetical protein N9L68_03990 [bacterium]|nr:hypothetical protein [bacterium]
MLFKRLEDTLHEQTQHVIAQKQEYQQIHSISIMNDFPLNELKQVIQAMKPDVPAPPTAGLEETTRQAVRAEGLIMGAGIHGLMEHHAKEMKAHRIAMGNKSDLAAQAKSGIVERVIERIIEKQGPPPPSPPAAASAIPAPTQTFNIGTYVQNQDSRTVNMGGVDARSVSIGEYADDNTVDISHLARQEGLSMEQALQQMYHLGRGPARTQGQGGRHDVDILPDVDFDDGFDDDDDDMPPPEGATAPASKPKPSSKPKPAAKPSSKPKEPQKAKKNMFSKKKEDKKEKKDDDIPGPAANDEHVQAIKIGKKKDPTPVKMPPKKTIKDTPPKYTTRPKTSSNNPPAASSIPQPRMRAPTPATSSVPQPNMRSTGTSNRICSST